MPKRGIGDLFYHAVEIVRANYTTPISGLVETAHQGSGSNSWYLTFRDSSCPTVVLQVRQPDRALQVENYMSARKYLGSLVPSARLVAEHDMADDNVLYAYEMTCIPGMPFSMFMRQPVGQPQILTLARGLGDMLARCRTDRCLRDRSGVKQDIVELLQSVTESNDRSLFPFRSHFSTLLDQIDVVDNMPLVISNGDLDPTNVLVTKGGTVTGLVDWEDLLEYPIGWDLGCLHWLTGQLSNGMFILRDGYFEVELHFWSSFFQRLKVRITEMFLMQLEACMKISAVRKHTSEGKAKDPSSVAVLRMELNYAIPRTFVHTY